MTVTAAGALVKRRKGRPARQGGNSVSAPFLLGAKGRQRRGVACVVTGVPARVG